MKTVGSQMASLMEGTSKYRKQFAPFIKYMVLLVAVVLLYGWLFHVIMAWEGQDHTWFTGIYWALTVMSTLGFGDITFQSDLGRVFSTIVLLTGMVMLLIMLPFLFIRLVYAPWFEERSKSRIKSLQSVSPKVVNHVIICVNDPIAAGLMRRLEIAGIKAFVMESDPDLAIQMKDVGMRVIYGDADLVETYQRAGADRARLILANASDTVNSKIILTIRELSKEVPVIAVAENDDSIDVLELSGATQVLPLKKRLGEHLANRVTAGNARANVIGKFYDLVLAEFLVYNKPFEGKTIRETKLRELTGASIVGVWEHGRFLAANPDLELAHLAVPVVIGKPHQLKKLNELLQNSEMNLNPVLIIGGGRVGMEAAKVLKRRHIPVHIVEQDKSLKPSFTGLADKFFAGDAADRYLLEEAGVLKAPSILLTTHDDAINIYLTVYCRRLNSEARILTRFTSDRNVEAILRAGADFVLSYSSLGIQTVFSIVQGRGLIILGEGVDLFNIRLPSSLINKTLRDAGIGARTGLNVVALQENGGVITNMSPERKLEKDSILVVIGSDEQMRRFNEEFS